MAFARETLGGLGAERLALRVFEFAALAGHGSCVGWGRGEAFGETDGAKDGDGCRDRRSVSLVGNTFNTREDGEAHRMMCRSMRSTKGGGLGKWGTRRPSAGPAFILPMHRPRQCVTCSHIWRVSTGFLPPGFIVIQGKTLLPSEKCKPINLRSRVSPSTQMREIKANFAVAHARIYLAAQYYYIIAKRTVSQSRSLRAETRLPLSRLVSQESGSIR